MIRPHNRCRRCSTRHYPMCRDEARWPLAPLLARLPEGANPLEVFTVSDARYAVWLEAGIDTFHADRLAVRCGMHPAQVWPGWVEAGLSVLDRQYLDGGWRNAWLWGEQEPNEEAAAA